MLVEQSAWDRFPTEQNPYGLYKFTSIHISLSQSKIKTNRESYATLDWLGDIGGLVDALFILGRFIVEPFAVYALNSRLTSTIVRYNPSS